MKQEIIFYVLAISLLAGCAKATQPVTIAPFATETSALTIATTVTKASTSTITPLSTLLPPTHPTATVTSAQSIIKNCLSISDQETAMQDIANGTIIFFPADKKYPVAQDLNTGKKYPLPSGNTDIPYGELAVSPDKNKLAYDEILFQKDGYSVSKNILWVVNAHGDVLQKVAFEYGLWRKRWLDNERLLFDIWETDKNGRVLLVNPFKHKQHYVWNNLPEFFSGYRTWNMIWLVDYSPDLKWVVYYGNRDKNDEFIVYDIMQKQDIWRGPAHDYGDIAWSPDGNEVAITTSENLNLINRHGIVKPVFAYLSSKPSWSPDGHYLAFWNNDNSIVYDVQTDQMIDYCIKDETPTHRVPIWSPNSQQFILQGYLNGIATSVLIDIQKSAAYTISKTDLIPLEWMNSLP